MISIMTKFLMVAGIVTTLGAQAGTTVCAGKKLHFSDVRADFGALPPAGTHAGERFVSLKGDLLAKQEYRIGQFGALQLVGDWDVKVQLSDQKGIASHGGPTAGYNIYEATLSVTDLASDNDEVTGERVVCKTSWAMVP